MEGNETSPSKVGDRMLKMSLSNTRSIKGKTTDLQFLTANSDIICLTVHNVLSLGHRTVFCRDRNFHDGRVLIAVGDQLNPKIVDLSM